MVSTRVSPREAAPQSGAMEDRAEQIHAVSEDLGERYRRPPSRGHVARAASELCRLSSLWKTRERGSKASAMPQSST